MKVGILFCILICLQSGFGAESFLLSSELRTDFSPGSKVASYTEFSYTSAGIRIDKRVFDGVDTLGQLLTKIRYQYDSQARCTKEVLLAGGTDTLSYVDNLYSQDGLISAVTRNKNGAIRFRDSLLYVAGKPMEQSRYNATGTLLFYHRYSYVNGRCTSDSLFEADGATGFLPVSIIFYKYNVDASVDKFAYWRKSGDEWYIMYTVMHSYTNHILASTAKYNEDAVGMILADSVAYSYDASGNRILETMFDDTRTKIYTIESSWKSQNPVFATNSQINHEFDHSQSFYRDGNLFFKKPFTGSIILYSVSGSRIMKSDVKRQTRINVPINYAKAKYVIVARGTVNRSFPVSSLD